jgi:thiol-disulfide isomerase/thioredoxin
LALFLKMFAQEEEKMPSKDTIVELKKLAESKGGKCLSDVYINSKTKLLWECQKGHTWETVLGSIKQGHWCPVCAGTAKYTIEQVQSFADLRGGICLSDTYSNSRTKLRWQCAEGHVWSATFHDVKVDNTWCPHCYKFYSEEKCRYIFQSLFLEPFKKDRKALGKGYELDGYNEKLNLAFEYHGIQHYKYTTFFHKMEDALEQRQTDDQKKKDCVRKKELFWLLFPTT